MIPILSDEKLLAEFKQGFCESFGVSKVEDLNLVDYCEKPYSISQFEQLVLESDSILLTIERLESDKHNVVLFNNREEICEWIRPKKEILLVLEFKKDHETLRFVPEFLDIKSYL